MNKKMLLYEVINDGEKISLIDESEWLINPGDMPTVCTWIPTAEIEIEKIDDNSMFNYKLTNLETGESVKARNIKKGKGRKYLQTLQNLIL